VEAGTGKKGKGAEKKGGKTAPAKAPPAISAKEKAISANPDFRYIVRMANTDLDGKRQVILALTGIPGVGLRVAEAATHFMEVDPTEMLGNLPEPQTEALESMLLGLASKLPPWMTNRPFDRGTGETRHLLSTDLETSGRDDVNQMKMIRSYRGIRHERGQKVRGQRTKSNGRTGTATGVVKKAAQEAGAAKKPAGGEAKGKA
jgi:small subunit ribosomal protein S13